MKFCYVTSWMELEGIILSEKKNKQRLINTAYFHLLVDFKKQSKQI